jgi:acylphosphatase
MPDGTLLVVASGDQASLDSLLKEVWRGPAGAHVTAVDEQWTDGEIPGLPASFEVKL